MRIQTTSQVTRVIIGLVLGYLCMVGLSVVSPGRSEPTVPADARVVEGMEIWRAHNCVGCHSMYGLGGHLGPDLTDVISRRGPEFVRERIRVGGAGMPAYAQMDAATLNRLLAWLHYVDGTGNYPPKEWPSWGYGDVP